MIQRPKIGESEEDLIRLQTEFLKATGKVPPEGEPSISPNNKGTKTQTGLDIIIKEKAPLHSMPEFKFKAEQRDGFPAPFSVSLTQIDKSKGKKSLFAISMEKKRKVVKPEEMEVDVFNNDNIKPEKVDEDEVSDTISLTNMKKTIHEDNLKKLSEMTENEILEEQKKIMETLDPNLVKFLKSKKEKSITKTSEIKVNKKGQHLDPSSGVSESDENKVKEKLQSYIDSKWLNMDFIEKEKLEWIGDLPDKKALEPDQPYSARFDFNGDLQPFTTDIDVRNSLYHHGDEPERPGYTVQELYQLSRSQVLQQRILALNTLAKIIRKTKLGYYDKCFNGQLLHKFMESDLYFLLRFSIDENALIPSAIYCLYNLICNDPDEFCLDRLLGVTNRDDQPFLFDDTDLNKEKETDLKDHIVISHDLIKGLLRTDLLPRFSYILDSCSPNRDTTSRLIRCLIRISRHSLEAARKIVATPNLMVLVFENVRNEAPVHEGAKLLRVMASYSREVAWEMTQKHDLRYLVSFLDTEECLSIPKKDFYLLKLETLYLWRSLLSHGLFVDEFISWSPCLIRLLLFYTQKVDVDDNNDFDFELFTAITSVVIVCTRNKIELDGNIFLMTKMCLEKWLTQLVQHGRYNFAILKAIGSILRYIASYFKAFGVSKTNLDVIEKTNSLLDVLFRSETFSSMTSNLEKHSCIINPSDVSRDPDNLPSLCSVHSGGGEFLKLVQNHSTLPFHCSLVKYFKAAAYISKESHNPLASYLRNTQLRTYLTKVCESTAVIKCNWFQRYEIAFLIDLTKVMIVVNDSELLKLSFSLIPIMRTDDKKVGKLMKVIFDGRNWGTMENLFDSLSGTYAQALLKSHSNRYTNDLLGYEWMYKSLIRLRDQGNPDSIAGILRFISLVLEKAPKVLARVSHTLKYYYLCCVFLRDSNIFHSEIPSLLENIFRDVVANGDKIDLNLKVDKSKSFYDLYTELITQYAGVSYGLPIFAKFVLFPLQNRQNISFRKLIWFEYLHVLRVISLPFPVDAFLDIRAFVEPCETDESLLVAFISSTSSGVITKKRNPFVYNIAVGNLKSFLTSPQPDRKLLTYLEKKMKELKSDELRNDILQFSC